MTLARRANVRSFLLWFSTKLVLGLTNYDFFTSLGIDRTVDFNLSDEQTLIVDTVRHL